MNKHRDSSHNGENFTIPARSAILEHLIKEGVPRSYDQLLEYFEVPRDQHSDAFAARLSRMMRADLLIKNKKDNYCLAKNLDIVTGKVIGHPNGFGFVRPDNGGEDCFLHRGEMRRVLHGDHVYVRLKPSHSSNKLEGKVIEVFDTEGREIVGHFRGTDCGGIVEPDDARFARDIEITKKSITATEGDVVVVRITEHPVQKRRVAGEIMEVIGKIEEPGMEAEIAIRKHEIPHSWPASVQQQIKGINTTDINIGDHKPDNNRKDLRNMPLVTIDGSDARDFDDAVFAESKESGWNLYVAIADVDHYVLANSALDKEAFERGTSVYFPRRVIPMLPEELSNGICSLNPDEDRLAMICEMDFKSDGELCGYSFYPATIRSQARLTYEDVQQMHDDPNCAKCSQYRNLVGDLNELYALFHARRKIRNLRGAIDFEMPEPEFEFDDSNRINAVYGKKRLDSHMLIEECMLAANECAAEFLEKHFGDNAVYRNHDGPSAESLKDLRIFLKSLGLVLGGEENPTAMDYSNLVNNLGKRGQIAVLVQSSLLRSLSQAQYSNQCSGHFALSYTKYTHFTSPIRRYSDLVVHRLIKSKVCKRDAVLPGPNDVSIEAICTQCSFTERRAEDASNGVIRRLKAEFMSDKLGMTFSGKITGVKDFGVFVMLDDFFIDGLVHVSALGSDYFEYDRGRMELQGSRNGRRFKLGDEMQIKVVNVDIDQAQIDFALAENKHHKKKSKPKPKPKHKHKP